mgnify:CR=1 FL=1
MGRSPFRRNAATAAYMADSAAHTTATPLRSRLLTSSDENVAEDIARQLEALNQERQRAEKKMLEEAVAEARGGHFAYLEARRDI